MFFNELFGAQGLSKGIKLVRQHNFMGQNKLIKIVNSFSYSVVPEHVLKELFCEIGRDAFLLEHLHNLNEKLLLGILGLPGGKVKGYVFVDPYLAFAALCN